MERMVGCKVRYSDGAEGIYCDADSEHIFDVGSGGQLTISRYARGDEHLVVIYSPGVWSSVLPLFRIVPAAPQQS